MKKLIFCLCALVALGSAAFAGTAETYSKESKNVVPPCPEWYGDSEWNLNLWETYVFADDNDLYLGDNHAFGGGADLKYFFHRYFGIGIQGWVVNAERQTFDLNLNPPPVVVTGEDSRAIGAFLGTFTLRFPGRCSRFAPYIWGGGGVIFGGGDRDEVILGAVGAQPTQIVRHDSSTEGIGQIGAGFEIRFTRHIGWTNDFSWNFITRDNSDFGMARSGINFAF